MCSSLGNLLASTLSGRTLFCGSDINHCAIYHKQFTCNFFLNFLLYRSNINNWYKCKQDVGSLVNVKNGSIICENLTDIVVACKDAMIKTIKPDKIKPNKILWEESGPVLLKEGTGRRSIYRFDGSTSASFPTHNSCKSSSKNHKRGVANPYGQIFIK